MVLPSTSGFAIICQFFSECWVVGPVQWPVGFFNLSLLPWRKTLVTPLIIAMQNKKCKKEEILTFLNVLEDYFISHEKSGHAAYSKSGRMVALLNNLLIYDLCKSK